MPKEYRFHVNSVGPEHVDLRMTGGGDGPIPRPIPDRYLQTRETVPDWATPVQLDEDEQELWQVPEVAQF